MKSTLIDRATVIWMAGALVVWLACIIALWPIALDASGASTLLTIAATLCSLSIAILLPGRAVRIADHLLRRLGISDAVLPSAPRGEALESLVAGYGRATMRLLGGAALLATLGGALSTLAVFGAEKLTETLTGAVLLSPAAWIAWKFVVQLVGMLPISLGISVTFLTAGIIRSGSGRDIYASVLRDWLWASSAGLAIFALGWICGADLLAVAVVAGIAVLLGAVVIFGRRGATIRPLRVDRPIETPPMMHRFGIAAVFGLLTCGLVLQLRLACDAAGIAGGWAAGWVAVSVAMLTSFLRWADRKSRPPGTRQRVGATIGALSGLLFQGALGVSATAGGASGALCLLMAATLQVPVAALTAIVISRQRRLFASAGGRARSYVCSAAGGAGGGIIVYLVLGSLPAAALCILAGSLIILALAVVAGIVPTDRPPDQLKWATCGAALLFAVTVAMLGGISAARDPGDSIRTGTWLTLVGAADSPAVEIMPATANWRSERIDEIVAGLIRTTGGKWLGGIATHGDLPAALTDGAHVLVTVLDPPAVGDDLWEEPFVLARQSDFFAVGRLQRERFDGAYLSGLPADHPQAWRCYSWEVVKRFYGCVQRDGLAMMRITAPAESVGTALSAGRAFYKSVGHGWLVFDAHDDVADMLFFATVGPGDRPRPLTDLAVVSDTKLGHEWSGIRTMKLQRPGGSNRHGVSVRQLVRRLGSTN